MQSLLRQYLQMTAGSSSTHRGFQTRRNLPPIFLFSCLASNFPSVPPFLSLSLSLSYHAPTPLGGSRRAFINNNSRSMDNAHTPRVANLNPAKSPDYLSATAAVSARLQNSNSTTTGSCDPSHSVVMETLFTTLTISKHVRHFAPPGAKSGH